MLEALDARESGVETKKFDAKFAHAQKRKMEQDAQAGLQPRQIKLRQKDRLRVGMGLAGRYGGLLKAEAKGGGPAGGRSSPPVRKNFIHGNFVDK